MSALPLIENDSILYTCKGRGETMGKGQTHTPPPKAVNDNKRNQMNSNNWRYESARGKK